MENMQRVELEVEKHGREEREKSTGCVSLPRTGHDSLLPIGNNFQNYLLLKTINCSLITRFAFLEGSACKGAVE